MTSVISFGLFAFTAYPDVFLGLEYKHQSQMLLNRRRQHSEKTYWPFQRKLIPSADLSEGGGGDSMSETVRLLQRPFNKGGVSAG